MSDARTFKNEKFNSEPTTEKIHYLGELRILGQVMDNSRSKNPIGYVIMTEKTKQFKMYTVDQTKILLEKFKFVNAELKNGDIVNTECSMKNIPKFDTRMNVIDNFGVIVLGEITDGTSKLGYRIIDTDARVTDISEDELIKLSLNRPIINAKVVSATGNKKAYVSGIKKEFTKIEKVKIPVPVNKAENPWVKEKHVEKLKRFTVPKMLRWGFTGKYGINSFFLWRKMNKDGSSVDYCYLPLTKEAKLIIKNLFTTKENGVELSEQDKKILAGILEKLDRHKMLLSGATVNRVDSDKNDEIFLFAISQFMLNSDTFCEEFIRKMANVNITYDYIKVLNEKGLATERTKKVYNTILEIQNKKRLKAGHIDPEADKKKEFKTKTFVSGEDAAQLGFAISENNREMIYETKCGFKKTLKYIGDYFTQWSDIQDDYDEYKSRARCLGDVLAVANVLKLMNKEMATITRGDRDYIEYDRLRHSAEIIIAIAYLYESKAMKHFVDKHRNMLDTLDIVVPDYETISTTDYKLSPELKMYYASGFNVFLNDGKQYRYSYLKDSEIINYRQLGNSNYIEHPMLKNELASIVTMITNIDAEDVSKYIGSIRFL